MNENLLNVVNAFYKQAVGISPWRNAEHDLEEAIDHASSEISLKNGNHLMDLPRDALDLKFIEDLPIKQLYQYDSLDWKETDLNEIKKLSNNEKIKFESFTLNSNGMSKQILKTINSYDGKDRTGDKYVRMLFDCAILYYIEAVLHN